MKPSISVLSPLTGLPSSPSLPSGFIGSSHLNDGATMMSLPRMSTGITAMAQLSEGTAYSVYAQTVCWDVRRSSMGTASMEDGGHNNWGFPKPSSRSSHVHATYGFSTFTQRNSTVRLNLFTVQVCACSVSVATSPSGGRTARGGGGGLDC